jgi:hypothetical protein
MAYTPNHRSAFLSLQEGMSDGAYNKVSRNRDGVIDPATARARRDLEQLRWHTNVLTAATVKVLPDGTVSR